MRTGDGIRLRGWDGLVEDSPGSPWVPAGPSAWELGTSGDPRRKADDDYKSRTAKPLEVEPSVTTFVFVTPRRWPGARQWEQARRAEGRWHSVRVLDADDLAGWLRSQPGTHLWFSEKVGLQPLEVRTLSQWWDRFRRQTEPPIPSELLLAGREAAARRLLDGLQSSTASAIFVRAASRDEAIAFIAAAFETSKDTPKDALIATSQQGWERLSLASQPGVLIPHVDDPHTATAVGMGHRVIVPLSAGTTPFRGEVIELGPLDRSVARDVLVQKASHSFAEADRLAGLARRSFASFLRAPEFAATPRSSPPWAHGDRARLLVALSLPVHGLRPRLTTRALRRSRAGSGSQSRMSSSPSVIRAIRHSFEWEQAGRWYRPTEPGGSCTMRHKPVTSNVSARKRSRSWARLIRRLSSTRRSACSPTSVASGVRSHPHCQRELPRGWRFSAPSRTSSLTGVADGITRITRS